RVKQGGTDEEILEWCYERGRRLNDGDLFVWNGFASKLGWRDSIAPRFEERKKEMGIADRDDIQCIPDLIDFDEGRLPEASKPSCLVRNQLGYEAEAWRLVLLVRLLPPANMTSQLHRLRLEKCRNDYLATGRWLMGRKS